MAPRASKATGGRVRLADVAMKAGVSLTTASFVLHPTPRSRPVAEACACRVRAAASRLGYVSNYHAQSIRMQRSHTLAIAMHTGRTNIASHRLGISYFARMIAGIEAAASQAGYATILFSTDDHATATRRACHALRQRRVDGVLVPSPAKGMVEMDFGLDAPVLPIVIVDAPEPQPLPAVGWDQARGVELVLDHLTALGHRRFLWLGPQPEQSSPDPPFRHHLFRQLLHHAGLLADHCTYQRRPEPHIPDPVGPDQTGILASDHALSSWLDHPTRPTPTAIVAYNDITAIGALRALYRAGLRVPDDCSVVSFDNFEAGLTVPALTSVDGQFEAQGQVAIRLLLDRIDQPTLTHDHSPGFTRLTPCLIVRQSTGPAAPPPGPLPVERSTPRSN